MDRESVVLLCLAVYMAGILYIKWLEHKAIQRREEKTDAEIRRERFKKGENATWSHKDYRGSNHN